MSGQNCEVDKKTIQERPEKSLITKEGAYRVFDELLSKKKKLSLEMKQQVSALIRACWCSHFQEELRPDLSTLKGTQFKLGNNSKATAKK